MLGADGLPLAPSAVLDAAAVLCCNGTPIARYHTTPDGPDVLQAIFDDTGLHISIRGQDTQGISRGRLTLEFALHLAATIDFPDGPVCKAVVELAQLIDSHLLSSDIV